MSSTMWTDYALIGLSAGMLFVLAILLWQNVRLRSIEMTTAEVLAALDAANTLTTEIASDLDALIELVNQPDVEVPQEVADAVGALKTRLEEAAAKFTPGP